MNFGIETFNKLDKIRKRFEITSTNWALWSGIHSSRISEYRKGKRKMNIDHVLKLIKGLEYKVGGEKVLFELRTEEVDEFFLWAFTNTPE